MPLPLPGTPSHITRSLFPSCAVDEPGSNTQHATCSVSSAESLSRPGQFFFMGLAALGPSGTWRDRQVTPT
eukprot:scaffold9024_cov191-Isochrysis_galbana.AAC.3